MELHLYPIQLNSYKKPSKIATICNSLVDTLRSQI
jgi:hypothetical protein